MACSHENINRDNRTNRDCSRTKIISDLLSMDVPPGDFLTELLVAQCRHANADAAVILRAGKDNRTEVLALYSATGGNGTAPAWIDRAEKPFRTVMQRVETVIVREGPAPNGNGMPQWYLMVIPIAHQGNVRAAAAFRVRGEDARKFLVSHARLETTPLLLSHRELQLTMKTHLETMHRQRRVLEVLDAVNRPTRFLEAAMAFCNELATWLGCSRVSLGFLQGRRVQVRAMSHTDTFSREMQVVQAIETAMEECLDQDLEVVHPVAAASIVSNRAAAGLSESHGPSAVLSLPIRREGDVAAVVTLERHTEQPFDRLAEIEAIRLICDLCASRLLDLRDNDRWLGARLAAEARQQLGSLLGYEHTWVKLCAAMVFLMMVLLVTVKGEYRIKTPFTFKARQQQVVVAPFETFIASVLVEPGDKVVAGKTLLGTLQTTELRLKLAGLKAEQLGYRIQAASSMRDHKTADAQIAETHAQEDAAQIRLIETQIEEANLVAPISGWVISADLKQQIGAPVKEGDVLFEIADIDSLRAELHVPESSIARVGVGMTGTLASVGHPDQKIRFAIDRINPIAEVIDHHNVFRVRARILRHLEWMRPGMQGEARISAGRQTYLWIASHRLVDWLRMKLWI
jgi:multidrug resistance efflux pump